MSGIDHPIKGYDELKSWDKQIHYCDTLENLTDFEKERIKRSLVFLKEELGEDFLAHIIDSWHPLASYFFNLAPWTRLWLAKFAEEIQAAKEYANYPVLLGKIKTHDGFSEGRSLLQIGYILSRAGFRIIIDPEVQLPNFKKIPDLKLIDNETEEELFLEASVLGMSAIDKEASTTFNEVLKTIIRTGPTLRFRGRIFKRLSQKSLRQVVAEVERTAKKATMSNSFQFLDQEGVIKLGLAPESDCPLLKQWASDKNVESGLSGPPYGTNFIARLNMKIAEEQKQLPQGCPNIIVITTNNIAIQDNPKDIINEVEEVVYRYPHILFTIILAEFQGELGDTVAIMKDQNFFTLGGSGEFVLSKGILIFNKYCNLKVTPALITKIYTAVSKC